MTNVDLIKEVYGINTYTKTIDTNFTELIAPVSNVTASVVTV